MTTPIQAARAQRITGFHFDQLLLGGTHWKWEESLVQIFEVSMRDFEGGFFSESISSVLLVCSSPWLGFEEVQRASCTSESNFISMWGLFLETPSCESLLSMKERRDYYRPIGRDEISRSLRSARVLRWFPVVSWPDCLWGASGGLSTYWQWPFQWWSRRYNSGDYGSGDSFACVFFFFIFQKLERLMYISNVVSCILEWMINKPMTGALYCIGGERAFNNEKQKRWE